MCSLFYPFTFLLSALEEPYIWNMDWKAKNRSLGVAVSWQAAVFGGDILATDECSVSTLNHSNWLNRRLNERWRGVLDYELVAVDYNMVLGTNSLRNSLISWWQRFLILEEDRFRLEYQSLHHISGGMWTYDLLFWVLNVFSWKLNDNTYLNKLLRSLHRLIYTEDWGTIGM